MSTAGIFSIGSSYRRTTWRLHPVNIYMYMHVCMYVYAHTGNHPRFHRSSQSGTLKCTSDFVRTRDSNVVDRTISRITIRARLRAKGRKRISDDADTIRREGLRIFCNSRATQRIGATSATPHCKSPPPLGRRFTFVWFLLSEVSIFP